MSSGQGSTLGKRIKLTHRRPPKKHKESLLPSISSKYFINPIVYGEFLDQCGSRKVSAERQICQKFLRKICWPYIDIFVKWGWWDFITTDRDVFIDAVRIFYYLGDNRNRDENGDLLIGNSISEFRSRVLDEDIIVNDRVIYEAIGEETRNGEKAIPSNFDFVKACQLIYGMPGLTTIKQTIHDLPFHNRVLHLVVCQTLMPRHGGYTSVTHDDMYWMYKIMMGEQIDLSVKIVAKMVSCLEPCRVKDSDCVLPYAKLVSKLIDNVCSVPTNEPTNKQCKMKILNDSFLRFWTKNEETGEYRRKTDVAAEEEEEARANEAANEAAPDVGNILDELRLMHWTNQERFDEIVQGMGAIVTRQTEIEKRQATLEAMFRKFSGDT